MVAPPLASRRLAAAAAVVAAALLFAAPGDARTPPAAPPEVALVDLPVDARDTYLVIGKGGPYRYDRDGIVFGNREALLPAKPRGYYHEYTVPTPDVKGRGARRIVCGGETRATPRTCYYTDDHYQSFRRIRE